MECNIMGYDKKVVKKPCYKTKYKNIVIVKLKGNKTNKFLKYKLSFYIYLYIFFFIKLYFKIVIDIIVMLC